MAVFDESKVINSLHADKAEVGKKYWYANELTTLKLDVESDTCDTLILKSVDAENKSHPFTGIGSYSFLYPYEGPVQQRMTNIQLMEWLAKGNGIFKYKEGSCYCYTFEYRSDSELYKEVAENIIIRTWDNEEWVVPTVDIYKRDCCKGGK